jgi:hypothetical protein
MKAKRPAARLARELIATLPPDTRVYPNDPGGYYDEKANARLRILSAVELTSDRDVQDAIRELAFDAGDCGD